MISFKGFNYDGKEKEMEIKFLELAHLNELETIFDFIDSEDQLFYVYGVEYVFMQNKLEKRFVIYNEMSDHFSWNYYDLNLEFFFNKMIEKYFKLFDYEIIT